MKFGKFVLGTWVLSTALGLNLSQSIAQTSEDQNGDQTTMKEVTVVAAKTDEKSPFLPDVQGTRIYAGKKTSVVRLKDVPPITNNNYRQALVKTPGLLLSEETTPLFSLGYRGLNPDRAQYMQVMKDGIPILADMFGYPEAYYTPLLQTVDKIEFIRGGSGLMFGPQPGGALNYVTKKPVTDRKLLVESENAFGSDNYFSTYEAITGTLGPVGYQMYVHERQGDGFRTANSDFEVISGGIKITLFQTGNSRLTGFYDEYHEEHGEPGGLTLTGVPGGTPTYEEDRDFATRLFDRFRLERYAGGLIWEHEFSERTQLDLRLYGGHYRRWSKRQRGGGFGTIPTGSTAGTNDIQEQDFYNLGFEPRLRHNYELFGNTHTLTFGMHTYFSNSPKVDERGANPEAETGPVRKESYRSMEYFSIFLENLFRWGKLSITPGVRLEHIWQQIEEKLNLDKTSNTATLANERTFSFEPLFGLGIVYEIVKGLEAYTNFSQSYRPKIFADAVPTGTNQVVDKDLDEGHAWQYDVGLRGKPVPFFSWDIDYFIMHFNNQTGTVGNSIENVGNSLHNGMELFTEVDVIGAYDWFRKTDLTHQIGSLSPFVTLTVLHAEFDEGPNEGKHTAFSPQYNFRFGTNYAWRDRVKVSLLSTFMGDHYADDAETRNRVIPSYKVWDLSAEVKLLKDTFRMLDVSIFGGINNLFDEQYYARITSTGIDPAYPRNVFGGIKVSLGTPSNLRLLKKDSPSAGRIVQGY